MELPGASSHYEINQLTLAPNWRYVTWTGTQHVTKRVYLLAVARETSTQEVGVLIALTYDLAAGWVVANQDAAYCGLLPPDQDVTTFEAANPCGHMS